MKAEIPKRVRKAARQARRAHLLKGYRQACRDEISRMRQLKMAPDAFRAALKQLQRDFSHAVAGRMVAA